MPPPFDRGMRAPTYAAAFEVSGGPGRARTDDIHGVNVALYQLSYRPLFLHPRGREVCDHHVMLDTPVIAAPMAGGPTTPALVRAAHAAGSFGFVAGGNLSPEALADHIADLRSTATPFGVNLFVPSRTRVDPDDFHRYRAALSSAYPDLPPGPVFDDDHWHDKVALLADVPAVSFTFGMPDPAVIRHLRRNGTRVIVTVTNIAEADAAATADALVVQGSSAGGHSGAWDLNAPLVERPTAVLVAEIRAHTSQSLIAAGGVAGADDARALLHAGADAVQVGTLLLRTPEAGTSPTHRAALTDPRFTETILTRAFTGRWARSLRNDFAERFDALAPAGYPEVHRLTQPLRAAAARRGDAEALHLWAGTGFRSSTTASAADVLRALTAQM